MADQPTTLDHAQAMLDHLRVQRAGDGHELARAMLGSAAAYLVETFGQQHAVAVAAGLLPSVLGVAEASGAAPGEAVTPPAEAPAATLH